MEKPFSPSTFPPSSSRRPTGAVVYDDGLRRHMLGVYGNMALGLGITALVTSLIASMPAIYQPIYGTPLKWVAIIAPLAFVLFFSFRVEKMTTAQARTAFYAFAAVMGISMASIFLVFTGTSIALAFFSAAAVFATMSLWGYSTNVDLSRWTTFLMVGLIGLVIASLVNLFAGSSTLQLVFSIAGILVFTGLTACDTQRLKNEYVTHAGSQPADKMAVMGALSLYLNVINPFQLMLSLFGQREE
jgi:uncharacterized protein